MGTHNTPFTLTTDARVSGAIGRMMQPLVSRVNQIANIINNTQFISDGESTLTPDGLLLDVGGGMSWSSLVFGYTITGDVVTIVNGELQWSDQGFFTVADTALTIPAGDGTYYVGCTFDGTTLAIPAASASKSTFASDANTFKTWLYAWKREDGALSRELVGNIGIIQLDASLG